MFGTDNCRENIKGCRKVSVKGNMIERRNDFGIYRTNEKLTYWDYAATTFMPDIVIESWENYQKKIGVACNRGDGPLSEKAQEIYDVSKNEILSFFDANYRYDLLHGKNATECLNLLVCALEYMITPGDIILMGPYEHHSNIIPWSECAKRKGACLVQMPLLENGKIDYSFVSRIDIQKIRILSISAVSNINSYVLDMDWVKNMIANTNAFTILDVSQAVGHRRMSFETIGADAYVMSAHKMYGPKNVGAVIIKKERIEVMHPFLFGGGMVWNSLGANPQWQPGYRKFEAGTFDVGLLEAWATACQYLNAIGMDNIGSSDKEIYKVVKSRMHNKCYHIVPGGEESASMISFSVDFMHPHDVGRIASKNNFEIRTGHMCAQAALNNLGFTSLCRLSWGIGSCSDDVLRFFEVLEGEM